MREVVEDWLRKRGGHLDADQFVNPKHKRWEYLSPDLAGCVE